jgi:hypothetical protein
MTLRIHRVQADIVRKQISSEIGGHTLDENGVIVEREVATYNIVQEYYSLKNVHFLKSWSELASLKLPGNHCLKMPMLWNLCSL